MTDKRRLIIAFVCNAKNFAIAFVVYFSLSPSCGCLRKWLANSFSEYFTIHYRKRVTKIGLVSLDTLVNIL